LTNTGRATARRLAVGASVWLAPRMTRVLIIGTGDMGERFAADLAASERVHELVLADTNPSLALRAATVASAHDCIVRTELLDARRQGDVEAVLRRTAPDLVVQAASLQSPWALVGRTDAAALAFGAAGPE
jgi:FlaA1/EpsC-like NDP-sugar epimerase